MLVSHLTCRFLPSRSSVPVDSDVFMAALMGGMAEMFRCGDREEGFVKVSEPSPFGGARASDVTNVGSREHSDRY